MSSVPIQDETESTDFKQVTEAGRLLGPIVEHFLSELDLHVRYLADGNTAFLFLTRAGARILAAYKSYCARRSRDLAGNTSLFWSSRLLTCKGISSVRRDLAINTIGAEFAHASLQTTLGAVFRDGRAQSADLNALLSRLPALPLHEFVDTQHPAALALHGYLAEQSQLFVEYLRATIKGAGRVVLVDTGWNGTVQRLLAASFPEIDWVGLYFGLTLDRGTWDAGRFGVAHGLIFESAGHVPGRPETAFTLHRHLIESLFEPNAPSLEALERDLGGGRIVAVGGAQLEHEKFDAQSDPLYTGVLDYLAFGPVRGPGMGLVRYHDSLVRLEGKLSFPTPADADLLEGKIRSADFGRNLGIPALLRGPDRPAGETAEERITRSLWPQGQVALEYSKEKARRQQALMAPRPHKRMSAKTPVRQRAPHGRIAIITRTKDRPLLLRRAAESIAGQTYVDFVWVVVNDGGDEDEVLGVLKEGRVLPQQILFCSNAKSAGMEAASNIGIRSSNSEFIVIHDDDDSWHPQFLEKTVEFLESEGGRRYGGVITHSSYVSEEIVRGAVVERGRWPYHDWVQHIQLSELIVENIFPPIAFVFRRDICLATGLFDDKLPVLGDWDFNIRFLLQADIGVLPEPLAYYHHRDRGDVGTYSNSVVGGVSKHVEYNAVLRNKFIRGSAANPAWAPVASLLAQGYALLDLRRRLSSAARPLEQLINGSQSSPEAMAAADQRWCMLQVLRHQHRGLWRVLLVFRSLPDDATLARQIARTPLMPPADFDDAGYLGRYQDVAQAVAARKFVSGYDHYVKFGRAEGRIRPYPGRKNNL